MKVTSPKKPETDEGNLISTLGWPAGWLAALSVAITAIAVGSVA